MGDSVEVVLNVDLSINWLAWLDHFIYFLLPSDLVFFQAQFERLLLLELALSLLFFYQKVFHEVRVADLLQPCLQFVPLFYEIFDLALIDLLLFVSKLPESYLARIGWTSIAFHTALDASFLRSAYQRVIALV